MRIRNREINAGLLVALAFLGIFFIALPTDKRARETTGNYGSRAPIGISANHGKIFINGNSELSAFPNKTGAGTPGAPYIIENLVIDAGYNGSAIFINNTDLHLIIRNCTVFNSGDLNYDGGGIWLRQCQNINVSGNDVSSNHCGIFFEGSNNIISSNNVTNNWLGVYFYGNNNTVSGNTVSWNNQYGIYFSSNNYNTIVCNNVSNSQYGIYLISSSVNTISSNNVSNNARGIELSESNNNVVSANIATCNSFGIDLSSSSYNSISDNDVLNNTWGIDLSSSNYNVISGNNVLNNDWGFELYYSNDNSISGNNALNNDWGIDLYNSNFNTISSNNASWNNQRGISLSQSSNNMISGNNASWNNQHGIFLSQSNSNTISTNTVLSNTQHGIFLSQSSNSNTISGNRATGNGNIDIYLDISSGINTVGSNDGRFVNDLLPVLIIVIVVGTTSVLVSIVAIKRYRKKITAEKNRPLPGPGPLSEATMYAVCSHCGSTCKSQPSEMPKFCPTCGKELVTTPIRYEVVPIDLKSGELIIHPRGILPRSCPFTEIDRILLDKNPSSMEIHTKRGETVVFRFSGARNWGLAIDGRMKRRGLASALEYREPSDARLARRKRTFLAMLAFYAATFATGLVLIIISGITFITGMVIAGISPVFLIPAALNASNRLLVRKISFLAFAFFSIPLLVLYSYYSLGLYFHFLILAPVSTGIVFIIILIRLSALSWQENPINVVHMLRSKISSNWRQAFPEAGSAPISPAALVSAPMVANTCKKCNFTFPYGKSMKFCPICGTMRE